MRGILAGMVIGALLLLLFQEQSVGSGKPDTPDPEVVNHYYQEGRRKGFQEGTQNLQEKLDRQAEKSFRSGRADGLHKAYAECEEQMKALHQQHQSELIQLQTEHQEDRTLQEHNWQLFLDDTLALQERRLTALYEPQLASVNEKYQRLQQEFFDYKRESVQNKVDPNSLRIGKALIGVFTGVMLLILFAQFFRYRMFSH